MSEHALILFDIDGTLLMAGDKGHGKALLDAFQQVYDLQPDLDGVPLAGMLDAQITRLLYAKHPVDPAVAEEQVDAVMELMGDLYRTSMNGVSLAERLLPGAMAAVTAVIERSWTAGTLTGNARAVAEIKLAAAGLGHLTEIGAFGDSARERGLLVQAAQEAGEQVTGRRFSGRETILVGDTPHDISAARHAGAHVIAVATGRYDVDTLRGHEPDAVLPDLTDTDAFIEEVQSLLIYRATGV